MLVSVSSPGVPLTIDAATYVISGVCLWRLQPSGRQRDEDVTTFMQLRQGWREFASRPWIWVVTIQFSVFHALVFAPYLVLGPIVSGGSTAWRLIQGALGLGAVVGGLVMLRHTFRWPLRVAVLAQAGWAPVVAVLGWDAAPLVLLMVLALVAGLGASIFNISWETTIQDNVPERNLSSVNSYDWMTSQVSLSGGLAVVGTLAAFAGTSTLLVFGGLLQLVTCLALLCLPSVRGMPRRMSSSNDDHRTGE